MKIHPKKGTEPIAQAPFRNSPKAKAIIDPILDEMREKGRSQPSNSPWASPVFTVEQHGRRRMVIDFRRVNEVVERDQYPIPRQDDIFAAVSGARYITTFDLTKGFYQIPIDEQSRKFTAFTSHRGLEELTVAVMGFKNSASFFQRKMDQLLARWRWQSVIAYIDDLIVWSPTAEQHAIDIANVLGALERVNLTLSAGKAHVGYYETTVLGHKVGRLGLGTLEEKTKAMAEMKRPETMKDLETAIGTFGYYRHFIPNFAQIAAPLYKAKGDLSGNYKVYFKKQKRPENSNKPLIHQKELATKRFEWNDECEKSFEELKRLMSSSTMLMAPSWNAPFILYCDASYDGFGAALHQLPEGCPSTRKNERPILYLSRGLNKHERNYSPTELECGCLVWSVSKLSHYLDGADMEVVTDHSALQWILKIKDSPSTRNNNRLLRWSMFLSQFSDKLKITHRPGINHGNVDGLSRLIQRVQREDADHISLGADHYIHAEQQSLLIMYHDEDWESLYKQDRSLQGIYTKLQEDHSLSDHQTVYHAFNYDPRTKRLYCNVEGSYRLCVPASKLDDFIMKAHQDLSHLGTAKVLDRLRRDIWHPRLYREVTRLVRNCASCRENQIMRHKPWGVAQPVVSPSIPFHTVSMDFVTGLPTTAGGFDAFTTVTDKFTKTLRVYPCKTTDTASDTADRFFKEIYRIHGMPQAIVSDRDVRFTSRFWESMCKRLGIERKMTTSYNPQSDGQAEKSNQTVEIALRHYVDYNQENWDLYLPQIEFAINTAVNDTTGFSPYRLLYGIDPRDGLSEITAIESPNPSAQERTDELSRIRDQASGAIAFAQARQSRVYDSNHEPKEFEIGDRVMLNLKDFRLPGIRSNKIGPKRIGPFVVKKRHGKLAYELDLPESYRIHPTVSIAKLEPASIDDERHSCPPPIISEENEEEYEVERILDEKLVRGVTKYLIDWKGYPPEERTWEPASAVKATAPVIVSDWANRVIANPTERTRQGRLVRPSRRAQGL